MMLYKIIFSIIFGFAAVSAQTSVNINKDFDQAVKDYKAENWNSAVSLLTKISNYSQINSKTTLSLLLLGKINLKLKKYNDSEKSLIRLTDQFHESKYCDEANITLCLVYLEQKEYRNAFLKLCSVVSNSRSTNYETYARANAEALALNYLSAAELRAIYDKDPNPKIKPFLLLMSGKIHLSHKNDELASDTFERLLKLYPDSFENREAKKILNELSMPKDIQTQAGAVGVLLPLTSNLPSNKAASEILEGIKFALSEFNEGREKKIGLLIRDTEFNRGRLEDIHDEFRGIENLKCVIGPIYSSEVKDALEIFNDINVPIISPTATEDFLTEENENFFQANPTFITRGKLMAQYLYFTEGIRKIAILNSIDGYSPILSTNFSQEFEKLGGKIILRESYKSNSYNLTEQINRITASLNSIEGIYIPLSDRTDIPIIISHLSQLGISIPVFGDQDWMSASGLESATFLDNNLTFCSDYFLKFDDIEYQKFAKNFYVKTKMEVNRNILYGYDTMKYLLTIMRTSYAGSEAIKQKMISGISSTGFHNNICFDSNRINRYMNIVRYSNGKFELIDKFKLNY